MNHLNIIIVKFNLINLTRFYLVKKNKIVFKISEGYFWTRLVGI